MPARDPSARFSTMSRASTILNRPQQAPLGPRTRNRTSNMPAESLSLPSSPPYTSASSSFSTLPSASNLYLPEFGPTTTVIEEGPTLFTIPEASPTPITLSQSPLSVSSPLPVETPPVFEPRDEPLRSVKEPPLEALLEEEPAPEELPDEEQPQEEQLHEEQSQAVPHTDQSQEEEPPVQTHKEQPQKELLQEEQMQEQPQEHPVQNVEKSPRKEPQPTKVEESAYEADKAPAYVEEEDTTHSTEDFAATTVETPSSFTMSLPSQPSAAPSRTPSSSTARTLGPSPKLTPAPTIRFETEPVQWKGLTLDAALWTFDSRELQSIVSRAIRSSALESFIRLLTLESLDQTLPEELKRLESSKSVTQAKYRFLVHRRTMQLQALLSTSSSPSHAKDKDNEDGMLTNTKLVTQLSETVAECDLVMEELLKVTDQINQIKKLIDHHWSSALAIALRKLNGSFGRRTADLKAAREKIAQLEASLDEAWNEAERMAREMDDIDAVMSDDEDEAIIETAEKVSISLARATSPSPGPDSLPLSPILLSAELKPDVNGASLMQLSQLSPLSPVSSKSRASKENQTPTDVPDSVSIKSTKSTKSAKSFRSVGREITRSATISAARTRSYRASQNSLRLPPGVTRKQSNASRPRTPHGNSDEHLPPVPNLPLHFATPSSMMSAPSANASSTLLHLDAAESGPNTYQHMRRTSLDSARGTFGHRTPLPWQNATMDDMFIGAAKRDSATLGRSLQIGRESGIQLMPRTPPPAAPMVVSMEQYAARPRPRPTIKERVSKDGGSIPSIWMNVDAPKTPAERVDSLMRGNSKGKTYQRLRTLTKRYSLPFPIFSSKSNSSSTSPISEPRLSSHRSG